MRITFWVQFLWFCKTETLDTKNEQHMKENQASWFVIALVTQKKSKNGDAFVNNYDLLFKISLI